MNHVQVLKMIHSVGIDAYIEMRKKDSSEIPEGFVKSQYGPELLYTFNGFTAVVFLYGQELSVRPKTS